jgi:hypothetical protein
MIEFSIENHKMTEFSQGKRTVDWLGQCASARLGHGSVEARAVGWSTQGRREARAGTCVLARLGTRVSSVGWLDRLI